MSSLTVQLGYTDQWIFVDEVEFKGSMVPEPSTYALMALGLTGLLVRSRRHSKA